MVFLDITMKTICNLGGDWGWKISICAILFLFVSIGSAEPVSLTGSSGKKVDFAILKEATPKGITAHMTEDGPLMGIPWDKLDLPALKREHPLIYAAYEQSQAGETIDLQTLSDTSKQPEATVTDENGRKSTYPGWFDTSVSGVTYLMQMPVGEPRGVLFVGQGDDGFASTYLLGKDMGTGPWADIQNKYGLAVMTYHFTTGDRRDPTNNPDFIFAGKGSGAAVLKAINDIAIKSKQESLIDAPIALFGSGKVGGGFAYNFTQWVPERVMTAVVAKGGFYDQEATEASAKVPMLFIWGEYSNAHEIWGSENDAKKVLAENASLKPNWTSGREFRGNDMMNLACEYFAVKYLESIIERRIPEKVEKKPEPEPEEGAENAEGAEAKEGEEEEEPEPETPPLPVFPEIERSKGFVGNVETGEAIKMKDPSAELGEDETFIPQGQFVTDWKKFVTGQFRPPPPPGG